VDLPPKSKEVALIPLPLAAITTPGSNLLSVRRTGEGGTSPRRRAALVGLLSILLLPSAAAAGAPCELRKVADLPVTLHGARRLRPVVATTINGVDSNLIFDTGGAVTMVFQEATARLNLHPATPPPGFEMRSFGQVLRPKLASAGKMGFGGLILGPATLMVIDGAVGQGIDGFLGQSSVGNLDVEFDLPHGFVRLFAPVGCEGQSLAYWAGPQRVSVVELDPFGQAGRPFGRVKVNGVSLRALFDSGTPDTDLTADAARRAGVSPASPGVHEAGTAGGVGAGGLRNWRGPFSSLVVGDEVIPNLILNFTEKPHASADLIIGADYFVNHRILISKSQGKLYATPVGDGGLAAQPKKPEALP
jgi:hypothetical protein